MDYQENLKVLSEFLGFGDPATAQIIFIGNEFGGDPKEEVESAGYAELVANRTARYKAHLSFTGRKYICLPRKDWPAEMGVANDDLVKQAIARSRFQITERIQSYFSISFRRRILKEQISWELNDYRTNEFCARKELQLNLYPIQAPRVSSPYAKKLLKIYNLPTLDKDEIKEMLWQRGERAKLFEELIREVASRQREFIVLFMGCEQKRQEIQNVIFPETKFQEVRRNAFDNCNDKRTKILHHSEDGRVWFTQHPSSGWLNQSVVDFIIDAIDSASTRRTGR